MIIYLKGLETREDLKFEETKDNDACSLNTEQI